MQVIAFHFPLKFKSGYPFLKSDYLNWDSRLPFARSIEFQVFISSFLLFLQILLPAILDHFSIVSSFSHSRLFVFYLFLLISMRASVCPQAQQVFFYRTPFFLSAEIFLRPSKSINFAWKCWGLTCFVIIVAMLRFSYVNLSTLIQITSHFYPTFHTNPVFFRIPISKYWTLPYIVKHFEDFLWSILILNILLWVCPAWPWLIIKCIQILGFFSLLMRVLAHCLYK